MKFAKGSKAETRRKLLGGAVTTPLLLTLRPASAVSASSAYACIQRNADRTWPGWQEGPGMDEAFRMAVPLYKVKYQGTQYECYKVNGMYKEKNTGQVIGSDVTPGLHATATDSDYALVYVDSQGKIVGQYPERNGGTALSTSCWSSLV